MQLISYLRAEEVIHQIQLFQHKLLMHCSVVYWFTYLFVLFVCL